MSVVPAAPVRDHLLALEAAGWTVRAIERESGVCKDTIHSLRRSARPGVNAATAQLLLAVRPQHSDRVPAHGPARRVRALAALGWPDKIIAEHANLGRSTIANIRDGRGTPRVKRATAAGIDRAFRALWEHPGPSETTRRLAARHRWALPMEWDDIDDPDAQPVRARRRGAGRNDAALERRAVVAAWMDDPRPEYLPAGPGQQPLHDRGGLTKGTADDLAHELRCDVRTIERDKARIRAERAREADAA
ncbi:hypothetical protein ACXYTP_23505 [Tsukamurella ocularis]